jgi:hypothetical protein
MVADAFAAQHAELLAALTVNASDDGGGSTTGGVTSPRDARSMTNDHGFCSCSYVFTNLLCAALVLRS